MNNHQTTRVTADNLTVEQIREIDPFDVPSQIRADALGLPRSVHEYGPLTPSDVRFARQRCADAINARVGEP